MGFCLNWRVASEKSCERRTSPVVGSGAIAMTACIHLADVKECNTGPNFLLDLSRRTDTRPIHSNVVFSCLESFWFLHEIAGVKMIHEPMISYSLVGDSSGVSGRPCTNTLFILSRFFNGCHAAAGFPAEGHQDERP